MCTRHIIIPSLCHVKVLSSLLVTVVVGLLLLCIPYSLDQTLRVLFISLPEFVRRLLIPVAAREAILRETIN